MDAVDFAERSLLARLLHAPDLTSTLVLTPQDFREPPHRALYAHLQALVTDPGAAADPADAEAAGRAVSGDAFVSTASTVNAVLRRADVETEPLTLGFMLRLLIEVPAVEDDLARRCHTYAEIVLDGSIRHRVAESGLQIAAAARPGADVRQVLDKLAHANADLTQAVTQWAFHRAHSHPPPDAAAATPTVQWNGPPQAPFPVPSTETVASAERGVIAHALRDPAGLRPVLATLEPDDFGDPDMKNAFRAITRLYRMQDWLEQAAPSIAPATVAQHHPSAAHDGAAATEEHLHRLATTAHGPTTPDPRACADTVLHGRLTREVAAAGAAAENVGTERGVRPLRHVLDSAQRRYLGISEVLSRLDTQQERAAAIPVSPTPARSPAQDRISEARLMQLADRAHATQRDAESAGPTRSATASHGAAGEQDPAAMDPSTPPEVDW